MLQFGQYAVVCLDFEYSQSGFITNTDHREHKKQCESHLSRIQNKVIFRNVLTNLLRPFQYSF